MKAGKWFGKVIPYIIAGGMAAVVLCILYNGVDLARPLIYSGDGVSATYLVKTIKDTGWFLENPFVGGVFGGNWGDYTMCDNLSFWMIKFFCLFSDNCFQIFNLFYLSTFVLVAMTAYGSFHTLGVNRVVSVAGALLYSFLAYHQKRIFHIWLTPYFMVPLTLVVGIWIATDAYGIDDWKGKNFFRDKKIPASLVILFFSAFTGFYYAFFTCLVLCIAGVILLLKKARLKRFLFVGGALLTVCLGVLANVYPSLLYWMENGTNAESELVLRSTSDPETYALKLIQLLLPRLGHRAEPLDEFAARYFESYFLNNENNTATLGFVGSFGFILLLVLLFKERSKIAHMKEIKLLNLGILLTSTLGGIGSVFSFLISTPMRCYNRLSIYIAFLSFLCLGLYATQLLGKIKRVAVRSTVCIAGSLAVFVFGIWDQTESFGETEQAIVTASFDSDRAFVQEIEQKMPAGTMVYQLPLVQFPSGDTYELFKGYMHSTQTVWSYGGMQGREEDQWERGLTEYGLSSFLEHICYGGYRGLYIDKHLYNERVGDFDTYCRNLEEYVKEPPIISEEGRLYFYDLTRFYEELTERLGKDETERREKAEYEGLTGQNYGQGG